MSLRAGAVHHLAVCTPDLARAEGFYSGVLGLTVTKRHSAPDGSPRAIWLDLGADAFLALERVVGGPLRDEAAAGWHCVALRIQRSDRAAWRARLEAAGVPVERTSDYTLYLRDPDGALVALSHYPEPVEGPVEGLG